MHSSNPDTYSRRAVIPRFKPFSHKSAETTSALVNALDAASNSTACNVLDIPPLELPNKLLISQNILYGYLDIFSLALKFIISLAASFILLPVSPSPNEESIVFSKLSHEIIASHTNSTTTRQFKASVAENAGPISATAGNWNQHS